MANDSWVIITTSGTTLFQAHCAAQHEDVVSNEDSLRSFFKKSIFVNIIIEAREPGGDFGKALTQASWRRQHLPRLWFGLDSSKTRPTLYLSHTNSTLCK